MRCCLPERYFDAIPPVFSPLRHFDAATLPYSPPCYCCHDIFAAMMLICATVCLAREPRMSPARPMPRQY
jgi:hypothetical protein